MFWCAVEGLPSGEHSMALPVTGGGDLVCLFMICHNYKLLHLIDISRVNTVLGNRYEL
jgi:hypothetical protein